MGGQGPVEVLRPNLSWGGIGFFSRDPLPESGPIRIRLHFQGREGSQKSETVEGRILWNRRDGNFTAVGVAFPPIQASAFPLLHSFLHYAENFEVD